MNGIVPGIIAKKFSDPATEIEGFAQKWDVDFQTGFMAFLSSLACFRILRKFELSRYWGQRSAGKHQEKTHHGENVRCLVRHVVNLFGAFSAFRIS